MRYKLIGSIFLTVIILAIFNWRLNMEKSGQKIHLSVFDVGDATAIVSLKLLETIEGLKLLTSITQTDTSGFGYETIIAATPIVKAQQVVARFFVITHLLPVPPNWDVAQEMDSSYAVLYENAGGAINSIILENTKQARMAVNVNHRLESFSNAHFIKRQYNDKSFTVSAISEKKHLVVFSRTPNSDFGNYKKICDCYDALIVKLPGGLGVLYKMIVPGYSRYNIMPGVLYYAKLDQNFNTVGPIVKPLGDTAVFEFDADVVKDKIAIFATSEQNIILAIDFPSVEPFAIKAVEIEHDKTKVTQPSILITESHLYLAILASAQTQNARVLIGSSSLDKLLD